MRKKVQPKKTKKVEIFIDLGGEKKDPSLEWFLSEMRDSYV